MVDYIYLRLVGVGVVRGNLSVINPDFCNHPDI